MTRTKPSYSYIFKGSDIIMQKKIYDATGKVIKKVTENLIKVIKK